jgi:hypothetical protein
MNAPINVLIHLLMAAFVLGSAGCVVLIPVVALRFVSVLFEVDPTSDGATVQD